MGAQRGAVIGLAWVGSVGLVFFVLWMLGFRPPSRQSDSRPAQKVAVLPLEPLSQPADGLSVGVGEEIATRLTQTGLQVIPWITALRYRGSDRDPVEIAREVGADAVVHGTLDQANGRVRGRVQFAGVDEGIASWAQEFDVVLSDPRFVKRHIARGVVAKVRGEELSPGTARKSYEQGSQAYMDGNDERARMLYEQSLEDDPGFAEAFVGLGALYYKRHGARNINEAVRNYETALSLDPMSMRARQGLMSCYWALGRLEQCLQQIRQLPPELPEEDLLFLRGWGYVHGFLPDKATPILEQLVEENPEDGRALWALLNASAMAGDVDAMIGMGRTYLTRFGDDDMIHFVIGQAYHWRGDPDSAVTHLNMAVEMGASLSYAGFLGHVYKWMGYPDRAQEVLERERDRLIDRLRTTPDDDLSRGWLALCLAGLGDTAGVQNEAHRFRQEGWENGIACWDIGVSLAAVGDEEQGIAFIRRALDVGGNYYYWYKKPNFNYMQLFGAGKLLGNPRFRELVADVEKDLDRLRREY